MPCLLGGETVQQDAAFLQKYRHSVRHLAIADDGIDVQYARRVVAYVVLTAVPLQVLTTLPPHKGQRPMIFFSVSIVV